MSGKSYLEQPDLHTKAEHRAALLTYPGNLRAALRQAKEDPKKTLFGVAHGIPSVFVTKVLASAKPDFIWIDVEHGIFDRSTLYDAIHAAQHHSEGKSLVVVRVPKHDEVSLTTALDAGAAGIVIPHTESAQDIKDKIREIYYPPIGQRSFSPWTFTPGISDASLYPNDSFNMRNSNNHICIIPQIESVEGVANLDEIAAVEGVSGLMFGPGDFSADAGIEFRMDAEPHPTFVAAMTKMVTTAQKYGLPLVGAAMDPKMIPMMVKQGYGAIAVAFDVWGLANLIHGGIQQARASVQQEEAEPKAAAASDGVSNGGDQTNGATDGTSHELKLQSRSN